jgi:hypothetical protein
VRADTRAKTLRIRQACAVDEAIFYFYRGSKYRTFNFTSSVYCFTLRSQMVLFVAETRLLSPRHLSCRVAGSRFQLAESCSHGHGHFIVNQSKLSRHHFFKLTPTMSRPRLFQPPRTENPYTGCDLTAVKEATVVNPNLSPLPCFNFPSNVLSLCGLLREGVYLATVGMILVFNLWPLGFEIRLKCPTSRALLSPFAPVPQVTLLRHDPIVLSNIFPSLILLAPSRKGNHRVFHFIHFSSLDVYYHPLFYLRSTFSSVSVFSA